MKNSSRNLFLSALMFALLFSVGAASHAQQSPPAGQSTASSSTKPDSSEDKKSAAQSSPAPAPKPATQPQTPPASGAGLVWVNTESRVYHKPGSRFYGKTKKGKYMTESDARKAGYRPAAKE